MENLCVFLILALVCTQAFAVSYRYRRQDDLTEKTNESKESNESEENHDSEDSDESKDSHELEASQRWNIFPRGSVSPRPWQQIQLTNQNQTQGRFPNQNQNQSQLTSTAAAPGANNVNSAQTTQCLRNCPVTPEYNPVCGSNNVTYDNPGRLYCAQSCGVNVNLLRSSRCPASVVAS